jgi:hypothetical protein
VIADALGVGLLYAEQEDKEAEKQRSHGQCRMQNSEFTNATQKKNSPSSF